MSRIGFCKRDITPPIGMGLGGYAGHRPCTGIHDRLFCRAVVLEENGTRYGLAVLDLMCADESLWEAIARQVAYLGIAQERLVVSAIHSHSAPAGVVPEMGPLASINRVILPQTPGYGEYMDAVAQAAAEALAEAAESAEAFRIRSGRGPAPAIGSERHTGGYAFAELTAIQCRTDSGKNLLLYNFPCHPTVMSPANLLVSADLVGGIEEKLDSDMAVFLNGAAGDISTRFTRREASFAECDRMARLAAEAVRELLADKAYAEPAPLTGRSGRVELMARPVQPEEEARRKLAEATDRWRQAEEAGADPGTARILKSYVEGAGVNLEFSQTMGDLKQLNLPVRAFRFGGFDFVTVPGELYSTLLPEGASAICYANGYYRYIADRTAYETGHYEAMAAILAPGQGEQFRDALTRLLGQLNEQEETV